MDPTGVDMRLQLPVFGSLPGGEPCRAVSGREGAGECVICNSLNSAETRNGTTGLLVEWPLGVRE